MALYESSAGQVVGGGDILIEDHQLAAREHTRRLLPMVAELLAASETRLSALDGIAFGRGPGSFTGLRIALGAVQGLAFGADLPVLPISTLAALAQTAVDTRLSTELQSATLVSAIDARMHEIYWSVFAVRDALVTPLCPEQLSAPEAMTIDRFGATSVGVGTGWIYAEKMPAVGRLQAFFSTCLPRASAVARLADGELRAGNLYRADQAVPTYIRDQVAWQVSNITS